MHIVVVGLSHRTAPVEVREKLSIPDQSITDSLKALKAFSDVLEVSILSTCNRLEIYALVKDKNIISKPKCRLAIKKANNIMGQKGRILVRKSGTEPKIRIMAESYDKSLVLKCIKIIKSSIK